MRPFLRRHPQAVAVHLGRWTVAFAFGHLKCSRSADADEAKLRLVNLRRRVGFTFGLGDGSVVCGFSFKGTLVPFTTIATIAGVPSHPDVIGVQTSEGWLSLHDAPCATLGRLDEVSCCPS